MNPDFNHPIYPFVPYFLRFHITGYPQKLRIEYKDNPLLKRIFFFKKSWYRTYFLIVNIGEEKMVKKINSKEKNILKPYLKSANEFLHQKLENKKELF